MYGVWYTKAWCFHNPSRIYLLTQKNSYNFWAARKTRNYLCLNIAMIKFGHLDIKWIPATLCYTGTDLDPVSCPLNPALSTASLEADSPFLYLHLNYFINAGIEAHVLNIISLDNFNKCNKHLASPSPPRTIDNGKIHYCKDVTTHIMLSQWRVLVISPHRKGH